MKRLFCMGCKHMTPHEVSTSFDFTGSRVQAFLIYVCQRCGWREDKQLTDVRLGIK